jgi:hypothetical protein
MGVSVRHNARLAALVGLAAAVMTVAWFARALQSGSPADWAWCVLVATVGVLQLFVLRDSRAPLMVADEHGVRVRRGETWSGLRWQDIEHVDVQSPRSWLRDGRIVVHPRVAAADAVPAELTSEPSAVGIHEGGSSTPGTEAYVVPLARTTRLTYDGTTGDLVADLDSLASGRVPVLVLSRLEPGQPAAAGQEEEATPVDVAEGCADAEQPEGDPAPQTLDPYADELEEVAVPVGRDRQSDVTELSDATEEVEQTDAGEDVPEPAERGRWAAYLSRVVTRRRRGQEDAQPAEAPLAQDADPGDAEQVHAERADAEPVPAAEGASEPGFDPVAPGRETRPAARSEVVRESVRTLPATPAVPAQRSIGTPLVVSRVDDFAVTEPQPVREPLIGPLVAAARNRARLSIDVLSERTRIRPHVLECIEVDDFAACGGDFYARGHLRTLARVFGLDAQQLLDLYDDNYATPEIEARQVFEAELASGIGGGVRTTSTGPRWSLLVACVIALASVWGMARVFNDTPQELVSPAPDVVDSAGLAAGAEPSKAPRMTLAPLEVAAEGVSPQVVVRDRDGRILWAGKLASDQRQQVIGLAPFEVTASNGGAVKVWFLGKAKGAVGESQEAASRQFG